VKLIKAEMNNNQIEKIYDEFLRLYSTHLLDDIFEFDSKFLPIDRLHSAINDSVESRLLSLSVF
jgi:hypothetical protein